MSAKGTSYLMEGSVTSRLLKYLQVNEDEELTIPDVMTKFDCTRTTAGMAVVRLSRHGVEYAKVVRLKAKGVAS